MAAHSSTQSQHGILALVLVMEQAPAGHFIRMVILASGGLQLASAVNNDGF